MKARLPEFRLRRADGGGARPESEPDWRALLELPLPPGPREETPGDETPLGGEVRVNTVLAPTQYGTATASLAGGGYVVVFGDIAMAGSQAHSVYARIYDSGGNPLSLAEFKVNTAAGVTSVFPSVAGLADGGFVVVWQSGAVGDIRGQRFDAAGAAIGTAEFPVNSETANEQLNARVTALDGGGFLVVWDSRVAGSYEDVRGQIYNAAGAPVGSNFLINAATADEQSLSSIDGLPGGGFVAVWQSIPVAGSGMEIIAQRFDAGGNRVGAEFQVNVVTDADQFGADVAVLPGGGFVVSWAADNLGQGTGGRVFVRRFDANGTPGSEGEILVAATSSGGIGTTGDALGTTSVTALTGGYFMVSWIDARSATTSVFAQVYNRFGSPVGGPFFLVNESAGNNFSQTGDSLTTLANGTVVVGWAGNSADDTQAVLMRRYAIEMVSPINGTSGPDTLTGTAEDDVINGLGGNDVLNGAGGSDLLDGGSGDDTFLIDAADQVVELVGGGSDVVYAAGNYVLSPGSEIEVLSAFGQGLGGLLELVGNEFAQTLIGNAGSNFLNGAGGADVLYGLGGDDTYVVDAQDLVIEGAGDGNDALYARTSYTLNAGAQVEVMSAFGQGLGGFLELVGNEFAQTLIGNAGANLLNGGGGADVLYGLGGDDTYVVDAGDLVVEGPGGGTDALYAATSYTLNAGAQVEVVSALGQGLSGALDLIGNEFAQTLIGNAGSNFLNGGGGADVLYGLGGSDTYVVDGDDLVIEFVGGGGDALYAVASYVLAAGSEVEVMSAFGQSATGALDLTGNAFAQTLIGNAGANVLDGGAGGDALYGLGGADTFAFTTALGGGNVDVVGDFSAIDDSIFLDDAVFTGLATGALSANAFVIGTAAADADDRIVYDQATGRLFFDADGNGAGAAVQFATLHGTPAISASDFTVI